MIELLYYAWRMILVCQPGAIYLEYKIGYLAALHK